MEEVKHFCGIAGLHAREKCNMPEKLFYPLFALQHRGQESCGITYYKEGQLINYKDIGMVGHVLGHYLEENHLSRVGIGHVRYSTKGGNRLENAQPISISCNKGEIALAHNGTISNSQHIRNILFAQGSIFQSTTDSELILHMIARSTKSTFLDALVETLNQLEGAFSLVLMHNNTLIAVRDPYGFRPLVMGQNDEFIAFSSESCALDILRLPVIHELDPGELVMVDEDGNVKRIHYAMPIQKKRQCIFELIYFARPDSTIFNYSVYTIRKAMGKALAAADDIKPDLVIPVPDSGIMAALGYAEYQNIPFEMGLTRNHYTGRSFIKPTSKEREFAVRMKLHPIKEIINNKCIVLIDDSLVRGTTSKLIVQLLLEAGAKEVHLRLSSPQIKFPCFYGIDIPDKKDLISHRLNPGEIAKYIGAHSVKFLDIGQLRKCVMNPDDFCYACFNGEYPTPLDEELEGIVRC